MAKTSKKKSGKKPGAKTNLKNVIKLSLEPPPEAITPPEKSSKNKK